ncbi:MAG: type II secretion system F family protein [Gammaproteobacteria bacterium]|nr:type II secretion system F family protein [Gammaproteobacteria bacterium]NND39506.1 type II secretion system F family protein [Pseudomonadales bacterium]MBT8150059.1 type II secretion system F family protein [Gammaproteobacteria bacterium]NNL11938.1 type II secretion system F family protein [Pseudomonadales bacterium]NNM10849.1 type II secretion system F family protein [Pseudomonadales bacterium]
MATQTAKMQTYVWEGKDRSGKIAKGELTIGNQALAKAQLRKQGIVVKTVKRKPKPLFGERSKAIKPMDIAVFTRQLATMLKAGVPLVQAFDIVAEGLDNASMRKLVIDMKNDVASGAGLANSLTKHPKYFDDLFCNLVNAGEQSGALETMLDRVATYKEKTEILKGKIKKAMTYPIAVVVVAIVVTALLLVKVVPQFAETFSSFGADLPAFTQFVVMLSEWAQANWLIGLVMIIAGSFAFGQARERSQAFSDWFDSIMLKMPVVGEIIEKSVVARFGRTLATTFSAGVPLVDSLDSVAGAAGNAVYKKAIFEIRDEVTAGLQLNQAVKNTGIFPTMLIQMISIGEESGALDEMLEKVALHYEAEVDNSIDSLTALLEPLIMSVLGVLVGGLMIAMYLPIFQLGNVM